MPDPTRRVPDRGPAAGQVLVIDGHDWTVGDHATYRNDKGYAVDEWECRDGAELGYLLKEGPERPQWLFTRQVPLDSVALSSGDTLEHWLQQAPHPTPPTTLRHRGQTYAYTESTQGTYQDSAGDRSEKTTWEYWDAARAWNLAIEQWPRGDVDCYHGQYVSLDVVRVRAGGPSATAHPIAAWTIVAAGVFVVLAVAELPVELCLSVALAIMTLVGFATLVLRSRTGWLSALTAPLLVLLFSRFPPLTSPLGLAAILLVPAATTRWAVMRDARRTKPAAVRVAFFTVGAAVLVAGLYHYFWFAPGPRSFGQYVIALGPAPLAGLAAAVTARIVLAISE